MTLGDLGMEQSKGGGVSMAARWSYLHSLQEEVASCVRRLEPESKRSRRIKSKHLAPIIRRRCRLLGLDASRGRHLHAGCLVRLHMKIPRGESSLTWIGRENQIGDTASTSGKILLHGCHKALLVL